MTVHIFGIRHHGPGSARSLRRALLDLQPDAVLVEGPPDAEPVLPLLAHPAMQPPVALLITVPNQPHQAVFYPFSIFSPEWQALHYGLSQGVAVRFMDLPQAHQMMLRLPLVPFPETKPLDAETSPEDAPPSEPASPSPADLAQMRLRYDPLSLLAEAAGYGDGEAWWDRVVEQRRDSRDVFEAILEAIAALRAEINEPFGPVEAEREAYMRKTIREAQKQGFERIAVVCGAWHAPALASLPPAREDNERLKGLPKTRVDVTWIPWTYSRLDRTSGYGAGVASPGWYDHLWHHPDRTAEKWITRAARLLRGEDLDASTAQIIDAVRLAEATAALRGHAVPALDELSEAIRATLCFGGDAPMALVHHKLIVGEVMGAVPGETPVVPLQRDVFALAKRLRMPLEDSARVYDLDLRRPGDLERSHLLHRLSLLGIPWGQMARDTASRRGTFHELWQVKWSPEMTVAIVEASVWGNTVETAAGARACDIADRASDLAVLTRLVEAVMLSSLPAAIHHVMQRLQDAAAVTSDVGMMMDALPPLASVLRYGSVRQTDTGMAAQVIDGLVARICVGLPGACASLDDEAAALMFGRLLAAHSAIALLQNGDYLNQWRYTLAILADQEGVSGLIAGRSARLLFDAGVFSPDETARRMRLALSPANDPQQASAWIEGFLRDSGLLLLHDEGLWGVLDEWVVSLSGEAFKQVVPLLRRTFSTFAAAERRIMGEKVRQGGARMAGAAADSDLDPARADLALPLVAMLLGLHIPDEDSA